MKKMILAVGAIAAAAIVTSCAGVTTNYGGPATAMMGPNFFTNASYNAFIGDVQSTDYKVVKHGVEGSSSVKSFFGVVHLGDASFETLKKEALNGIDADDIIDVRLDYDVDNIIGLNTVKVTLRGTAIKYK